MKKYFGFVAISVFLFYCANTDRDNPYDMWGSNYMGNASAESSSSSVEMDELSSSSVVYSGGSVEPSSSSAEPSSSSETKSSSSVAASSSSSRASSSSVPSSSSLGGGYSSSYGSVTYEGKTYKTVVIGTQTWMAENLNYAATGSKCVDGNSLSENNTAYCDTYGRLYNWESAKTELCPSGWHLPINAEWDKLFRFVDGDTGSESPYGSKTAGKYLKSVSGWNNCQGKSGNGTDDYGFSALPSGYGGLLDGSFVGTGGYGIWWSASKIEGNSDYGYYRLMSCSNESASWNDYDEQALFSVRCVKD